MKNKTPWNDNSIQFPRLIAELEAAGAFTPSVVSNLRDSMDLTKQDIFEIVERATTTFDKIKSEL